MPNISHIRPELAMLLDDYRKVEDFLAGPSRVRAGGTRYLPMPEPYLDTDSETTYAKKKARYDAYVLRAVFYDVVAKTLGTLVGQIFAKDTVIESPKALDDIIADADHAGTTIEMQAKQAVGHILSKGRCGLLVDYPDVAMDADLAATDGVVTQKQLAEGYLRPRIVLYNHKQLINWRTVTMGGKTMLSLLVLEEDCVTSDDGFEEVHDTQYRVLRFDPATMVYSQEVWQKGPSKESSSYTLISTSVPRDSKGMPFQEIPFACIGWENNTPEPDSIPMLGLTELANGLWHCSADYFENAFYTGQCTMWFSGLSEDWVKLAMKNGVKLGAREAVLLPEGGAAGLLNAPANTQVKEAMDMLREQLVELGARFVEGTVAKTATEDSNDEAAITSVLSSSANNVSAAYVRALGWCAQFVGVELNKDPNADDALDFRLNTDFAMSRMTPQERQVLLAEWQGGALTFEEYRWNLKRANVAYLDDTEAQVEIDREKEARIQQGLSGGGTVVPGTENKPPGQTPQAKTAPEA